jgi:hypothetical protein
MFQREKPTTFFFLWINPLTELSCQIFLARPQSSCIPALKSQ